MEQAFGVPTLVVTEESSDEERAEAMKVGKAESPYDAVVSVLMLREGWDVPEVSVICLLRKFSSKVYGQQVIGRGGQRKVLRKPDEPEILCVVDHPKLEHDWLWELVKANVKGNVKPDDSFDPDEDLPPPAPPSEPDLVNPKHLISIKDPEGADEDEVDFRDLLGEIAEEEEPRKDWPDVLAATEYDDRIVEITGVELEGADFNQSQSDGIRNHRQARRGRVGAGCRGDRASTR